MYRATHGRLDYPGFREGQSLQNTFDITRLTSGKTYVTDVGRILRNFRTEINMDPFERMSVLLLLLRQSYCVQPPAE